MNIWKYVDTKDTLIYHNHLWSYRGKTVNQPKRRSITFPAEIAKRGNAHYITVLKSYMEMLGVNEGDVVDVTIRRPDEEGIEVIDR